MLIAIDTATRGGEVAVSHITAFYIESPWQHINGEKSTLENF